MMKHDDLTYTIIGFAYKVHNVLGAGFLAGEATGLV
jgi:hypothetical protein